MKSVRKTIVTVIGLAVALTMSGCGGAALSVMGIYGNSIDYELRNESKTISIKTPVKFQEGKSYVVYIVKDMGEKNHIPSALYEVIEGKVVLAGLINESPGRMVMEVKPGKHTYFQKTSCGLCSVTIDVKKGYGYYIKRRFRDIGKNSVMDYCRGGQGIFSYMGYIDEVNVYSNYENYTLVPENIELANSIVQSNLQSDYESFVDDADSRSDLRRGLIYLQVEADQGFRVGSRL